MKTIEIVGDILDDYYGEMYERYKIPASYPKKVKSQLAEAAGDDVEININSGGGDVFSGFEIYTAILQYKGNVRINVTGLAASAASVIMCAGECYISPVGTVMVHCSACRASGNHNDLEKAAETLKTIDESICNAYIAKTGMDRDKAIAMMEDTTWLTADRAVELGLCDGYMKKVNTSAQSGEKSPDGKKNDKRASAMAAKAARAKARFLTMKGENANV